MLKRVVFLLALGIVGWKAYELAWPFIDADGVVEQGSYRGFEIGETKAEVVTELYSPFQRVRLGGYEVGDTRYSVPILGFPEASLSESDSWDLTYPGLHKEVIVLTFEEDRVVAISYRRDMIAP